MPSVPLSLSLRPRAPRPPISANDRGMSPAGNDGCNRISLVDREHDDRHTIFPSKRERRRIHDPQIALDCLPVGEPVEAPRVRIFLGVGTVDAIDVGGLEYCVAT